MTSTKEQTYYEILEVAEDAPQHIISEAYRRAKATYSPDSPALYTMFTVDEAKELLALIEEAYLTLSNFTSRQEYDLRLRTASGLNETTNNEFPEIQFNSQEKNFQAQPKASKIPEQVPEGFAKTRFGIYELDREMEALIADGTSVTGEFLRSVRTYKKISLDQLSQETKISRSYIAAIESDDYESLPARVFVRGFVIQIAKILGLSQESTASEYLNHLKRVSGGK